MNEKEKKNVSRKILDGWKEEISYNIGERGNFIFDGRAHNDLARALGGVAILSGAGAYGI